MYPECAVGACSYKACTGGYCTYGACSGGGCAYSTCTGGNCEYDGCEGGVSTTSPFFYSSVVYDLFVCFFVRLSVVLFICLFDLVHVCVPAGIFFCVLCAFWGGSP